MKILQWLSVLLAVMCTSGYAETGEGLQIKNGWMIHDGKVIWGLGQYNQIWGKKGHQRPNITRNAPGKIGPHLTEDLGKLTDSMLQFGYPVFEHNFGLWYDRRRDKHGTVCRISSDVESPFLEQPWSRSEVGRACDGLPLYDLEKFNPWYFKRLREFAELSDQKGTILYHNFYQQHALLEDLSHYVDFPWRPGNAIQDTGLPRKIPATSHFFEVSHPVRRQLHKKYIRKVLDEIGEYKNVIHFTSAEYTANYRFVKFWMDTILEWENEKPGRDIKIGIAAPRSILDYVLQNPQRVVNVDAIDLRYFWYDEDGKNYGALGGRQEPGRNYYGELIQIRSSPERIFQQTYEYRKKYPDKVIFHSLGLKNNFMVDFLMGGGSINVSKLESTSLNNPETYVAPDNSKFYQPLYDFVRTSVAGQLGDMIPDYPGVRIEPEISYLGSSSALLLHVKNQNEIQLDLTQMRGEFEITVMDASDFSIQDFNQSAYGWQINEIQLPEDRNWLVYLEKKQF